MEIYWLMLIAGQNVRSKNVYIYMKEDEIGRACSTNGREEECI
jgi:hypothetical protein